MSTFNRSKYKTVVVFDLDETLGHFTQLYIFWSLLNIYLDCKLDKQYFFQILDDNPEFIRPNMVKILKNLKNKKLSNKCDYVMIYTNNNGPKFWVNLIKDYFEYKLNYKLFDRIIRAFKINGEIIEPKRTSYEKKHSDFINCTRLPENTQICFLDDQKHIEMEHPNVFYINIEPYLHNEDFKIMGMKFYKKNETLFNKLNNNQEAFINYIIKYTKNYKINIKKKSIIQKNIEYILSNHIGKLINNFFNKKIKIKTNRITKINLHNKTRKLKNHLK